MNRCLRRARDIALLLACLGLPGCATLAYYSQSVAGHRELMQTRRPLPAVINDVQTPRQLSEQLRRIRGILAFAHDRLSLPDNGSYRHYADLRRPFVTWNVFAAPELSLQPHRWCYLFVGCLSYRGYFERDAALDYAAQLRKEGWDVYVGGVRAYSTLGWFRDPVLNTMLEREDWRLARLLFHELAHQKIYLNGRTALNEAFAESVARIGLELWLKHQGSGNTADIRQQLAFEDAFMELLLDYKDRLKRVFESELPEAEKRRRKSRLYGQLRNDYQLLKRAHPGHGHYDDWMAAGLNNAKLIAVATYRRLLPQMLAVYEAAGRDLGAFYEYVAGLGHCTKHEAVRRLRRYDPENPC